MSIDYGLRQEIGNWNEFNIHFTSADLHVIICCLFFLLILEIFIDVSVYILKVIDKLKSTYYENI